MLHLLTMQLQMLTTRLVDRLHDDEDGATIVEYGLLIVMVSIIIAATVAALNTGVTNMVADINAVLDGP
jgi:Flp pilus assembly pilin Flp